MIVLQLVADRSVELPAPELLTPDVEPLSGCQLGTGQVPHPV